MARPVPELGRDDDGRGHRGTTVRAERGVVRVRLRLAGLCAGGVGELARGSGVAREGAAASGKATPRLRPRSCRSLEWCSAWWKTGPATPGQPRACSGTDVPRRLPPTTISSPTTFGVDLLGLTDCDDCPFDARGSPLHWRSSRLVGVHVPVLEYREGYPLRAGLCALAFLFSLPSKLSP